jgi:hypothetical protein
LQWNALRFLAALKLEQFSNPMKLTFRMQVGEEIEIIILGSQI